MPGEKITKEDLEQRIRDWEKRISNLYKLIKEWVNTMEGYNAKTESSVQMNEELMQEFSLRPVIIKTLDIYYGDKIVASVKPVALWVIGANGRLDILYKNGSVILVDKAEPFHLPEWVVFSPKNRGKGQTFNKNYFVSLVKE